MKTIGEYLLELTDAVSKNPDISSQPLYSKEGILFGYEDEEDTARRFGTSVYMVRVWVNEGKLEGVKSNDHLTIPKSSTKPEEVPLPIFLEVDNDGDYSGLLSE